MTKTELEKKMIKLEKQVEKKQALIMTHVREIDRLQKDFVLMEDRHNDECDLSSRHWVDITNLEEKLRKLEDADSTLKAMVKLVNKS